VCPLGLLSPQHYRQQQNDHQGTYSVNFGDQVVFVWNNGLFKATMPLTTITNVGILRSAPGHNIYASFVEIGNQEYPTHFCSAVVTDDKADEFDAGDEATLSSTTNLEGDDEDTDVNSGSTPSAPRATTEAKQPEAERPSVIPFDLNHDDPSTNVPSQDDATSTLDSQAELLRWHYRLGHLPFTNIRLMAARVPRCQSEPRSRGEQRHSPTRSKQLPNLASAYPLTNHNPQFLATKDKAKDSSSGSDTKSRPFLATISAASPMSIFRTPPRERRRYSQRGRSKLMRPHLEL
jgi:hypothetical protein